MVFCREIDVLFVRGNVFGCISLSVCVCLLFELLNGFNLNFIFGTQASSQISKSTTSIKVTGPRSRSYERN